MSIDSLFRLLVLSALWGGSFLFMRIAVPVYGPAWLVFGRVGFGALFLLALAVCLGKDKNLVRNWKHYGIIAFFNSALPFFLFGVAASVLTTSQLAILNATAPTWGYLIGMILRTEVFKGSRVAGLILGMLGVYVIFQAPAVSNAGEFYLAVCLCLMAACSYGIASNYAKKAKSIEPFMNAYGSMWYSTVLVAPALLFFPVRSEPTVAASLSVVAIGVLCSGVAYLLYFRLIKDIGATSALTVTFLIPIFGSLWGYIFLGERQSPMTLVGIAIVIAGTVLVTGFRPEALCPSEPGKVNRL